MATDFECVVRKVADIGYVGVEPALGTLGATPEQAARLFRELDLQVVSAHTPLPLGPDKDTVLAAASVLDCKRIISGKGPDSFQTVEMVIETCGQFNEAHAIAVENGLEFGLHNHWWEFQRIDNRYVYELMLDVLDPGVFFQIDTYWVKTAGPDPAAIVNQLGCRAPLLHLKDGPATKNEPMLPIGSGVMDFHRVVQASAGNAEWLIVELDRCAIDMVEAVERSYRYLIDEGLAYGRK
jgi:sugar phosphate isomerase/epimerase